MALRQRILTTTDYADVGEFGAGEGLPAIGDIVARVK
jgi:hypothetical protein